MENNSLKVIPLLKKRNGKIDCQTEAKGLLEELILWKEESHRRISNIVDSHCTNLTNGIKDLEDEVSGLHSELLVLRKERTVLLETVDYLHSEIRNLKSKLLPLPEVGKEVSYDYD